jgi:hypothetical protein
MAERRSDRRRSSGPRRRQVQEGRTGPGCRNHAGSIDDERDESGCVSGSKRVSSSKCCSRDNDSARYYNDSASDNNASRGNHSAAG